VGLTIHVDGGARGNPGPAGAGIVIHDDERGPVCERGYFLGRQTNNAAEYHALIRALQRAALLESRPVAIHSDSELLVRQITGAYRVKSPKLEPLFEQAQMLLMKLSPWTIRHVRREQNQRADELANLAMDRRGDVIELDVDDDGADPDAPPADDAEGSAAAEAGAPRVVAPHERAVRVVATRPAGAGACPAGGVSAEPMIVQAQLPAGLCVHAAHALLPTLLAILNTDAQEFSAVPTMTVRCGHPGCRAEFQLAPVQSGNGSMGAPRE
jgi:ribonuclease HI